MKKIMAVVVFTILAYTHVGLCMEIEIVQRNPRNIVHLLQNDGQWLDYMTEVEAQGNYCQDLCSAREALKKSLSGKSVYASINSNFPGMYAEDEKWLSHQFGKKAARLAINAVQQVKVVDQARWLMSDCSTLSYIDKINDFVKSRLCDDRIFTQLNLFTHFYEQDGETLFHYVASQSLLNQILQTMLLHHSKPDPLDAYGRSPLFCAMQHGAVVNMYTLMKFGANPYIKDCNGITPLHVAAEYNQHECIEAIDSNGIFSRGVNNFGDTPLHVALKNNASPKTIQSLIRGFGFCGTLRNLMGKSYLDLTIEYKQKKSEQLIAADLNKTFLNTRDHRVMLEELLQCGADVNAKNENDQTILHRKDLDSKTITMLIKYGAQVNSKDKDGRTPLHVAVDFWLSDAVSILLESGALVTPKIYNILCGCHFPEGNKQRIFDLVIDAYKKQECCICLQTQQQLDAEKKSLSYIPCKVNHKCNFICEDCYKGLLVVDGKKQCLYGCLEGLGEYEI